MDSPLKVVEGALSYELCKSAFRFTDIFGEIRGLSKGALSEKVKNIVPTLHSPAQFCARWGMLKIERGERIKARYKLQPGSRNVRLLFHNKCCIIQFRYLKAEA